MQKLKDKPEQLICAFTERPAYYYIGERRIECPLPNALKNGTAKRMQVCGTCNWHYYEPIDRGYVCVNKDNDRCADWTEYWFRCDKWEVEL